eukprot:1007442-Pyramimonas_sp.AAC.1
MSSWGLGPRSHAVVFPRQSMAFDRVFAIHVVNVSYVVVAVGARAHSGEPRANAAGAHTLPVGWRGRESRRAGGGGAH